MKLHVTLKGNSQLHKVDESIIYFTHFATLDQDLLPELC